MKSRQIIKERLAEAAEEIKKTPFEISLDKIIDKLDKAPIKLKVPLYKSFLKEIIDAMAVSSSNKSKMNRISKEFLRDFQKHVREE